jgi:hypothetical protein
MILKINGTNIAAKPKEFTVTVMDIDSENTTRTANGTLTRDRVAVKRQIEITFPALKMSEIAQLLQSISNAFFEVFYPDPMEGTYVTKTFYVGNRPCPVAIERNGVLLWDGLKINLTER